MSKNTSTIVDSRSTAELCRRFMAGDATAKDTSTICRRFKDLRKQSQKRADEELQKDEIKKTLQKEKAEDLTTKRLNQNVKNMTFDEHQKVCQVSLDRIVIKKI